MHDIVCIWKSFGEISKMTLFIWPTWMSAIHIKGHGRLKDCDKDVRKTNPEKEPSERY